MAVWSARYSVTGNTTTYYWGGLVNTGQAVVAEIWLVVNGSVTVLNSQTISTAAGAFAGAVLFQLDGSWLNLSVNGVLATSADDGTLTGGAIGIRDSANATTTSYSASDLPIQDGPNAPIAASTGYDTPTFTWNSVTGAVQYELFVADNLSPQTAVFGSPKAGISVSGASFTPGQLQALTPGHNYTWYLGAEVTSGGIFWSGPYHFSLATLSQPAQFGPSGTIAASTGFDTPTFSWNADPGAAQYYLYVLDATTNKTVVNNASVFGTSYSGSTLTPGDSFTWYLGAESTNSAAIAWSGPKSFSLAALAQPTLKGPSGSLTEGLGTTTVSFSWNSVTGAVQYYLYVLDTTTNVGVVSNPDVFGTSVSETLTSNQNYAWYLGATSTNGGAIAWSGPKSFSIVPTAMAQPAQMTPTETIAAGLDMPTFSWTGGASQYYLYVLDNTTKKPVVNNTSILGTTYSGTTLTPGHTYTWYIGAETSLGVKGPIAWSSEAFALPSLALPTPTQYGPSGTIPVSTGFTTPTFSWSSVAGVDHYYLKVLDTTTNQLVVNNPAVTSTSFTGTALTPGQDYTWSIGAVDLAGDVSWSAESFALALPAPLPISPSGAVSVGTVGTTPTFKWNAVSGAVAYSFYLIDTTTNEVLDQQSQDCRRFVHLDHGADGGPSLHLVYWRDRRQWRRLLQRRRSVHAHCVTNNLAWKGLTQARGASKPTPAGLSVLIPAPGEGVRLAAVRRTAWGRRRSRKRAAPRGSPNRG